MDGDEPAAGAAPGGGTTPVARPSARTGVARIVVDGAVPLLAFWLVRDVAGIVPGVLAATASATVVLLVRRRSGFRGGSAVLSAGLVALNATVGLLARNDAVYLAQGVVTTASTGLAFAATAATGRPLAGILAADLYGLPVDVWHEADFVRTFRLVSWVWAGFELLSAGLPALVLSSTDVYVVVSFVLGTPVTVALFWWSVRFANNRLL